MMLLQTFSDQRIRPRTRGTGNNAAQRKSASDYYKEAFNETQPKPIYEDDESEDEENETSLPLKDRQEESSSDSSDESETENSPEEAQRAYLPQTPMPETQTQRLETQAQTVTQAQTLVETQAKTAAAVSREETQAEGSVKVPAAQGGGEVNGSLPVRITETNFDSTLVSDITDENQGHILDQPETRRILEGELISYVNRQVFPKRKFPIGVEGEMKYCRIAAVEGKVTIPSGVTKKVFGTKFHKVIRKRMSEMRANTHASMKEKFDSEWRTVLLVLVFCGYCI